MRSICGLGPFLLASNFDARWPMTERYAGGSLVYLLPSWAGAANKPLIHLGTAGPEIRQLCFEVVIHCKTRD